MKIKAPPFDYETYEAQLLIFLPCEHPRFEPRAQTKTNGQPFYKMQCSDCGKCLSGQLAYALVEEFRATWGPIKAWDFPKQKAWVKRRLEIGDILKGNQNLRRHAAWWAQYEQHLVSPFWRAMRQQIFLRAGGRCEMCGERSPEHVHHVHYDSLGEEEEKDLLGVCSPCHQQLHPHRDLTGRCLTDNFSQRWRVLG
jgi:hypothetical protein